MSDPAAFVLLIFATYGAIAFVDDLRQRRRARRRRR
jgi:hypothetical protein